MRPLSQFQVRSTRVVLTDIDGTLTKSGRLDGDSFAELWRLYSSGFHIIPVTGRPAGWCEMIARFWPVHGVIGENGALYFRLVDGKMKRCFSRSKGLRAEDRKKLRSIASEVLREVPGSAVASDQFSRLFDLAIDFCEDVKPLPPAAVQRIVKIFEKHGAIAKISNIHVNGWFGHHDKLSTCQKYLQHELGLSPEQMRSDCIFVGDSPNDEPMFAFFPNSFAVANIRDFLPQLKHPPAFIADQPEADGFRAVAERLRTLLTQMKKKN